MATHRRTRLYHVGSCAEHVGIRGGGRNSEIYIYFRSHAPCAEKMLDDVVVRFGYPDVTGGKRYVAPGLVESSIQLENGRAEQ